MRFTRQQGVAALSAIAVLGGIQGADRVRADHKGLGDTPVMFGVTPAGGSGKFYDDREAGQCGLTNWSCYMTLTADKHFTDSTVSSWLTGAKNDWNAAPTTVFIDLRTDQNSAYDIHFKMSTLPTGVLAKTTWTDYHNNNCAEGDCGDPDGIAAHQPQRWWYTYVEIDKAQTMSAMSTTAQRKAIVSHEIGHTLGLAHHPNCEGGPSVNTIMYVPCIVSNGVTVPQPSDICEVTHASSPLMYGNDPNFALQQC